MSAREEFVDGAVDVAPAGVSIGTIGVIVGLTAVEIGLSGPQAVWMSLSVYTGIAQAAMLDLMAENAHWVVIAIAGALINARLLMYSASLAPHVDRLSAVERVPVAYLLIDVVYALTIAAVDSESTDAPIAYYLGAATLTWLCWQVGTIVGLLFGGVVPPGLNLQFAIPLIFIALLVPVLDDRPSLVAGAVGGVAAVLFAGLPFNSGLIVGTLVGVGGGFLVDRWWSA